MFRLPRFLFGIFVYIGSIFVFSAAADSDCEFGWMRLSNDRRTELITAIVNNKNHEVNKYTYPADKHEKFTYNNITVDKDCKKGQTLAECDKNILIAEAAEYAKDEYCNSLGNKNKPKNNIPDQQNNSDFGTAKCPLACHTNPSTRGSLVQRDWKNCSAAGKKEYDNDFQKYVAKTEESCAEWEKNKNKSPKKKEAEKEKNDIKTTDINRYAKIELANTEQAYRLIEMENPGVNVSSCVLKRNVTIKGRPQDTLTCDKSNEKIRFEFDDLSDRDNNQNGTVYASLQKYFCGKVDKNLTSGACMDKVAQVWGKKIEPVAQKQSASVSKEECEKSCASKICRQVKENSINYTCLQLNADEYAFKPDCESKCSGTDKKCKTERNAQGMYVYACKTLPPLAENEYTDETVCKEKCKDGKCRYSTHKERGHIYTCEPKNNNAQSDEQSELKKDLKSDAQRIIDAYNERKAVLESQKQ